MTAPKPKRKADTAFARRVRRELRYMSAEHVARDHRSPEARAAIAAVFSWMSLNGIVAWTGKDGRISTNAMCRGQMRDFDAEPSDAIVFDAKGWEEAKRILVRHAGDPPKRKRHPAASAEDLT